MVKEQGECLCATKVILLVFLAFYGKGEIPIIAITFCATSVCRTIDCHEMHSIVIHMLACLQTCDEKLSPLQRRDARWMCTSFVDQDVSSQIWLAMNGYS